MDKYNIPQVVDGRLSDTSQVADKPFYNADHRYVGVNFYYAAGGGSVEGGRTTGPFRLLGLFLISS